MTEKPNYYAILTADVRYDNTISDKAKLLYAEITALSNKDGYCYASNKYFAELYSCTPRTIQNLISELKDKYITVLMDENNKRKIFIGVRNTASPVKEISWGDEKNVTHNNKYNNKENININNNPSLSLEIEDISKPISIDNNIDIDKPKSKKFIKPTVEEIMDYCYERNNGIDAEQFYDFYESKGWKVGNQPMKDWKACVRTWEKNDTKQNKPTKATAFNSFEQRTYDYEDLTEALMNK